MKPVETTVSCSTKRAAVKRVFLFSEISVPRFSPVVFHARKQRVDLLLDLDVKLNCARKKFIFL